LLQSAFAHSDLNEDAAARIIEYRLQRNKTAHASHRKSWIQKHKRPKLKPLL